MPIIEREVYRFRVGERTILNTQHPVYNVVYRVRKDQWLVTFGLCNGIPTHGRTYKRRWQAEQAARGH